MCVCVTSVLLTQKSLIVCSLAPPTDVAPPLSSLFIGCAAEGGVSVSCVCESERVSHTLSDAGGCGCACRSVR